MADLLLHFTYMFRNYCKSYVTHVFTMEAKVMWGLLVSIRKKKVNLRAGTMAQCLRACAALQEDQVPFTALRAGNL